MMDWVHGWILLMNVHMKLMLIAVYVVFPKWYDTIYTKDQYTNNIATF